MQETLAKAYATHDNDTLRAELHRALGGICYFTLPQLDEALRNLHAAVKAKPQDPEQVKNTYELLQQALNAFWKTLEKNL